VLPERALTKGTSLRARLAGTLVAALVALPAFAHEGGLLGVRLRIVDGLQAQKVVIVLRGGAVHTAGPPAGPSATGATVTLTARAAAENAAAYELPAAAWVTDTAAVARYLNRAAPAGGGVHSVTLRSGAVLRIVARSLGDGAHLDLASGDPGPIDVVFAAGPHRLCASFDDVAWSVPAGGGARLVAGRSATPGACLPTPTTTSTTTSTLPGQPASCVAVPQPPASCADDAGCPPGYACAGGLCAGHACSTRADCPLDAECVLSSPDPPGTCICRGCGPHACPLACRDGIVFSGCICTIEEECPPEDDVCFLGFCS
jgi:hypothetical protein